MRKAGCNSFATTQERQVDGIHRFPQFRADPPPRRAARDIARAAGGAILDAARRTSADQGTQGADRRSRSCDSRRGRKAGSVAGERRQDRRGQAREPQQQPRPAQAPGGIHQRPGRAAARAGARSEIAARSPGILSRQISRDHRPRQSQAMPGEARIISRAAVSNTPFFPQKLPIVLIAGMAVLFIAAGWITTRELLIGNPYRGLAVDGAATAHARVPEPEREAPDEGGPVPPAPVVPGPSVVAAAAAAGIAPERLLADIAAELRRGDRRRILVAAADRGIDSTTAALALARVLRVVVVDLAFSAPKLAAISVDPGGPGLADLGRGTASFGQIITRDRNSRVHLVPAGHVGDEASAMLDSERLRMGIEALTQAYDLVVFDAGPVPDMQVARMAQLASTAVLVATALPEESATAKDRLVAGGVSDVKVLTCPPLPFGSDAQLAAAA